MILLLSSLVRAQEPALAPLALATSAAEPALPAHVVVEVPDVTVWLVEDVGSGFSWTTREREMCSSPCSFDAPSGLVQVKLGGRGHIT